MLRITKDEIDFYYSRNLHFSVAGVVKESLCRINGEKLTFDSVAVQHIQARELLLTRNLNRSQAAAVGMMTMTMECERIHNNSI